MVYLSIKDPTLLGILNLLQASKRPSFVISDFNFLVFHARIVATIGLFISIMLENLSQPSMGSTALISSPLLLDIIKQISDDLSIFLVIQVHFIKDVVKERF